MLIDLQKAIYDTLNAGLSIPVYDNVPQEITATDAGFPFVTIGEATFNEGSTDTEGGLNAILTIHEWSRYSGFFQVKSIQNDIYNLLNRQAITIAGSYGIAGITFQSSSANLDPDGKTRHGIITFNLYLAEKLT